MDIMLYFMKLEDKYWGLFLAALFLLYIFLFVQKKQEDGRWLVLYGFLTYLVFACPLAYRLFADYGGMEKNYYKVSHIELVVPVLCLALALAWQKIRVYRKKILPLFELGMVILFVFSGTLVYTQAGSRMPVQGCYREQEKEAYDLMLADAGDADAVTFWGPSELMAKSRIYSGRLQPIYGKISQLPRMLTVGSCRHCIRATVPTRQRTACSSIRMNSLVHLQTVCTCIRRSIADMWWCTIRNSRGRILTRKRFLPLSAIVLWDRPGN